MTAVLRSKIKTIVPVRHGFIDGTGGYKHVMILFPPVTPTNISNAELLHDRMKSQPYRWVSLPI